MRLRTPKQEGSILAIMLILSALIGLMLAAYLTMVGSQNKFTQRSQVWNNAVPIAESGVEEALAHINYSGTTSNFAINGWTAVNTNFVRTRVDGDNRCDMNISSDIQPVITVKGSMRAPLQTNYITRTIQVKTKFNRRFPQAILSKGGISIGGSGNIDSFDSTNSAYSTGGQYDPSKRHDQATIATDSKTSGAINIGNATVYGKAATGPGGTILVGGSGVLGSSTWDSNAAHKGSAQPGYTTDDLNIYIPDNKLPAGFSGVPPLANQTLVGVLFSGVGAIVTTYTYVLGDGDYTMDSINIGSHDVILVTGKARLYVKGATSVGGQAAIKLADGASMELYAAGSVSLGGGGVVNSPGRAANFAVYGLPGCTSVSYSGNSQFIGTINAPEAAVTLTGTADAIGAVVGASFNLNGGMGMHYDESLRGNPKEGKYLVASWQEI